MRKPTMSDYPRVSVTHGREIVFDERGKYFILTEAEIERLREHKCGCGISQDPDDACCARSIMLNTLLDDPRINGILTTEQLAAKMRERIEELEEQLEKECNKFHSAKQIFRHYKVPEANDAVWDYAWHHRDDDPTAIETLKDLGIVRCGSIGCNNGVYTEGNDDGSMTHDRPCQICNGHGWVLEADD